MADLPPQTIHVKRKRGTEEAPVDFLKVDRNKRFRNFSSNPNGWVYQRKLAHPANDTKDAAPSSEPTVPEILPTKEGDEKLDKRPKKIPKSQTLNAETPAPEAVPAPASTAPDRSHQPTTDDGIRKFHLSKSVLAASTVSRVAKRRGSPAVFVERVPKRPRSAELNPEVVKAILDDTNKAGTVHTTETPAETVATASSSSAAAPKPALKRPGSTARTKPKGDETKTTLPPSMIKPQTEMDELSMAMDVWTLNEISKNLELMDSKGKYSPATSRWKPHVPKQRHTQQHTKEQAKPLAPAPATENAMDVDNDTTDDEDYIIETYERVPAERLRDQAVPVHQVGLLVFDTEPDMEEFFYGNEDETDDEFPEDEEDEDAENYYTHDYPDEDLDWDDEFGRNACRYTNLSDQEEWDERENDLGDEAWERGDAANPFMRPG
ncbi:hypothetical protein QBC38DRAFT_224036 [Podospora fimiseda]|uniref:Transcription factor Iwr1 domain-containing protein n=1 Tax=Podospora fimiseda TaxID=252190 RepID=A0AAN7BXJ4_9PEZI|nr:hypothetical protein QBC38DRAFT_224036 [Podospora fimiseda]